MNSTGPAHFVDPGIGKMKQATAVRANERAKAAYRFLALHTEGGGHGAIVDWLVSIVDSSGRLVGDGESQDIAAREEEHPGGCLAVFDVAQLSGAFKRCLGEFGGRRSFSEVQHIVQRAWGRFRVQAGVAGKLETEVVFVNPDLSAVIPGEIGPRIEMVEAAAHTAVGDHVGLDGEKADDAGFG